jgi:hypothetical protein
MDDWKQGMNGRRFDIDEFLVFLASDDEDANCCYAKFVKVKGQWRFILHCMFAGHADIVDKSEYPDIEAAGDIVVYEDRWTLRESMSSTLRKHNENACAGQADIDELTELLGRPHKDKWGM